MRALLVLILLALAGCTSHPTSSVSETSRDPEVEVVASLFAHDYGQYVQRKIPLVVTETFSVEMLQTGGDSYEKLTRSLVSEASDEVPADLIRDFCAKNAKTQKVWPELASRLPISFLSRTELESLFSVTRQQKRDGWEQFYAKYPGSPGIITISRVGFNRQHDMAMVYIGSQSHWLAGGGQIHVLRKRGGKWTEVPVSIGPTWIS